jgi:hypothetical protein
MVGHVSEVARRRRTTILELANDVAIADEYRWLLVIHFIHAERCGSRGLERQRKAPVQPACYKLLIFLSKFIPPRLS